jgi:PAS domain S-box-containing protein
VARRARRKSGAAPVRRPGARVGAPDRVDAVALLAAFECAPVAATLVEGDAVLYVNETFARTMGLDPASCAGRPLAELLPPEGGSIGMPPPGGAGSYRTRVGVVPARVDLRVPPSAAGRSLVVVVVSPQLEDADTAASLALLALSREVAAARSEEELSGALARALEVLFPGRSFCIRLVDAKTLALTTLYARGRLKPLSREGVALRRSAVRKTGLSEAALEAGGVGVVDGEDEPVFEGCERARAVPLAVGGALFGVLNLEYAVGAPGDPASDEPLLLQVANQAALGVRNLRSIEELTFLKTYLEDLIENANALILVVNRDMEVLVFNKALSRLTAYSRDEALGEDLLGFVPDFEQDRTEQVLRRSLDGEPVTSFETRILLRGGGEAQVVFNTAPIAGSGGEVEGVIAIGQDLTALRALEERAEHYQRLAGFGRLAAGIVHELNNPLTSINVYADSLLIKHRHGGLEGPDVEKLRRIKDAGERIQRFSRDLITYARPSADKLERVDLAALMEQAASMCEPALKEAGARVATRFDAAPQVMGVKASLVQVFVNLVTNAAQALKERGGTVTLGLASVGDSVAATVTDDGRGMTPEVKSRIFEPFFTTKPDGQGSGLGLSIVQGIVGRHAGTIGVESLPGEGTTFTVLLPKNPPGA